MIPNRSDRRLSDAAADRDAWERAIATACSFFDALTPLRSLRPVASEPEPPATFFIDDYRIDLASVGHLIRGRAAA